MRAVRKLIKNVDFRQDDSNHGEGGTIFKSENGWRTINDALLVRGDVVALRIGQRAPADVTRLNEPEVRIKRDEIIPKRGNMKNDKNHELYGFDLFKIQASPLVSDVEHFLYNCDSAQSTSVGKYIATVDLYLRIGAVVAFILFGLVLNAIRFAKRPDGFSWSELMLTRPVTLLCLLPPLSWGFARFWFESYWTSRMQRTLKMKNYSCLFVARRWLCPGPARWPVFFSKSSWSKSTTPQYDDDWDAMPLAPSTLIHVVGSVTALSAVDEECLLMDLPMVEEMFLPKGEAKYKVIDLCQDLTAKFGLRFEDPQWKSQLGSLKPIGLACAMASMTDSPAVKSSSQERGIEPKELALENVEEASIKALCEILEKRVDLNHFDQLSRAMGFRKEDLGGFVPRGRCTLIATNDVLVSTRTGAASSFHGKPVVECVVTEVPAWQRAVTHFSSAAAVVPGGVPLPPSSSSSEMPSTSTTPGPSKTPPIAWAGAATPIGSVTPDVSTPISSATLQPQPPAVIPTLHVLCWGHPSLLLNHCSEYWDGESIWSLDEACRNQVLNMTAQWLKEDFDCCAFSYIPMPSALAATFSATFGGGGGITGNALDSIVVYDPIHALSKVASSSSSSLFTGGGSVGSMPRTAMGSGFGPVAAAATSAALSSILPSRSTTPPIPGILSSQHSTSFTGNFPPSLPISVSTANLTLEEIQTARTYSICSTMQRGQIFTGLVASRDQPRAEMDDLVESLHKSGVRFVYFSPRDARRSRKVAEKMGLETDWNSSVSLSEKISEEELHQQQQQREREVEGQRQQQQEEKPEQDSLQEPQEVIPVPVYTKRKNQRGGSQRKLDDEEDVVDWELKAHMPRGIKAIRKHIVQVDDVPLRVSLFTDSAPDTIPQMIDVMREWKEVVAVIHSTRNGNDLRACMHADLAVSVSCCGTNKDSNSKTSAHVQTGSLASSFIVPETESRFLMMQLLGEGRVAIFNYRQSNQVIVALSLVACAAQCVVFCLSAPDMFTIGHVIWLTWVQVPLLGVSVALRPRNRQQMLKGRMPWKNSAAPVEQNATCRFASYAIVRLLPVATFVCGMFVWALIAYDAEFADLLNWSSSANAEGNSTALYSNLNNTIGAQSVAMLAFVWSGCFLAASFASRTDQEYKLEFEFWVLWTFVSFLAIGFQLAYNCAYAAVTTGYCMNAFPGYFEVWIVLVLAPPVFVPMVSWPAKKHDWKFYHRATQMLRLEFETRLGQYSPR